VGPVTALGESAIADVMTRTSVLLLLLSACDSDDKTSAEISSADPTDTHSDQHRDSGASGDGGTPEDTGPQPSWDGSSEVDRAAAAAELTAAAAAFLVGLDDYQRSQVQYSLTDAERSDWSNLPHAVYARAGVGFRELNEERVALGWDLIRASLSAAGIERTRAIIQMEKLLWDDGDPNANPGNYFFTFFGTPSVESPWGWQLDGHHLALNFTVSGSEVTFSPSLWGTTPKTWASGEHAGLSPMAEEEDLAFAWMASLDETQLGMAQLGADLDPDLMAGPTSVRASWPEAAGVPASALNNAQRAALMDWVAVYVGNLSEAHAAERMSEIFDTLDEVSVAWMGGTEPGSMMYYRIQGPRVLIEFDHTRNADHIHAVYRDPQNDYGTDWLSKHLAEHHSEEVSAHTSTRLAGVDTHH